MILIVLRRAYAEPLPIRRVVTVVPNRNAIMCPASLTGSPRTWGSRIGLLATAAAPGNHFIYPRLPVAISPQASLSSWQYMARMASQTCSLYTPVRPPDQTAEFVTEGRPAPQHPLCQTWWLAYKAPAHPLAGRCGTSPGAARGGVRPSRRSSRPCAALTRPPHQLLQSPDFWADAINRRILFPDVHNHPRVHFFRSGISYHICPPRITCNAPRLHGDPCRDVVVGRTSGQTPNVMVFVPRLRELLGRSSLIDDDARSPASYTTCSILPRPAKNMAQASVSNGVARRLPETTSV